MFCSRAPGIDPSTGEAPADLKAQTQQAMVNLEAVLTAAGSSITNVVKTTIFYAHVGDVAMINAVYARHMPDPARSAPANVLLPRGLLISIEAIATLDTP